MPSQSRKMPKNERYVGIPDSAEFRKELLGCAKEFLVLLKENENSKDKLKKITATSNLILDNLNAIKNTLRELPSYLPKPHQDFEPISKTEIKPLSSHGRSKEKGVSTETKIRKIEVQIEKIENLLKEL